MNSPVSAQEPEYEHDQRPRRLSALYQYHNAPEVAPAHGLEYDDTIYPHSDKMTLVKEFPLRFHAYGSKHHDENRPPRIIFGMKVGTFLIVAFIVLLIVVGAAVGGAIGGRNLSQGLQATTTYHPTSPTLSSPHSISSTASKTSSTFSAPTPTYTPLSDCPQSNATAYTSPWSLSSSGNETFTKYCDLVPSEPAQHISGTFVYSFSDCVDLCASFNYANEKQICNVAFYQPQAERPINCWIGVTGQALLSTLVPKEGTDVAILIPSL